MTSLCWNIGSLHHYYTDSLKQHISVQLAHMLQSDLICSSCLNRVHQSHSTLCWRGTSRPPSQTYAQGSGLSRSETRTGKNYKHVWARSGQNYGLNQIKTNLVPGLDQIRTRSGPYQDRIRSKGLFILSLNGPDLVFLTTVLTGKTKFRHLDQIRSGLQSVRNWRSISSLNPVCGFHGDWQGIRLFWHLDPESDTTHELVPVVVITQVWAFDFTLDCLLHVIIFFSQQELHGDHRLHVPRLPIREREQVG